ncbi:MAG: PAS domain S-box protein [Chitinophagaceae bacterium]|nr:PAS domain S-box protein [Chitinophagaceae bacterium]
MEREGKLRLLIVEDNPGDYFLVGEYLKEGPWLPLLFHASSLAEATRLAQNEQLDVILLDLTLPDSSGLDSLKTMLPLQPNTPIIVLTGIEHEQYGVDSLKMGVQDYLVKDQINGPLLVKSIRYSIERSRARQAMTKKDRLFRLITDNSPTAKALITPEGKFTFCTHSVKTIKGYDEADLIGKHVFDFVHPEDISLLRNAISNSLANPNQQVNVEVRERHANGRYIWCEKSITNMLNDEQVNSLVLTFWDITESKNAEDRLKLSEERYRNLFEVSPASIVVWDIESELILQVNETAEKRVRLYARTVQGFAG